MSFRNLRRVLERCRALVVFSRKLREPSKLKKDPENVMAATTNGKVASNKSKGGEQQQAR